jgi:hypothetical protein
MGAKWRRIEAGLKAKAALAAVWGDRTTGELASECHGARNIGSPALLVKSECILVMMVADASSSIGTWWRTGRSIHKEPCEGDLPVAG